MKLVKRTVYVVGDWGDEYWQQRALEEATAAAGAASHEEQIYFPTRETAEDFARSVLQRFLEGEGGGPGSFRVPIAKAWDLAAAMNELPTNSTFGSDVSETRRTSEAEPFSEEGCVGVRFETEVRIGRRTRRQKTVTVDGEEFSRTVEETVWSSWYKGQPEMASVSVWPHEYLEAVEE